MITNQNKHTFIEEGTEYLKDTIPDEVFTINKMFKDNGFELYIVGGAVRDALLKQKPKDFDVATDATPDEVEKIVNGKYTLIDGGKNKEMGVTIITLNKQPFEIATFREDIGKGRRPDGGVKFTTIEEDVKRRDLTINALFYNIETEEIVDLVGGVQDLMDNKVRTVGNPVDRFAEDELRKLRSIRFAGVTFSELDSYTRKALQDNSLDGVSVERIRDEFKKTIEKAQYAPHPLDMLKEFGYFDKIFPGLEVSTHWLETKNWRLQLGSLLIYNDKKDIQKVLSKMTYTVDEIRDTLFLNDFKGLCVENSLELKRKNKVCNFSDEELAEFSKFHDLGDGVLKKLTNAFIKYDLSINGNDIMKEFGIKGQEVGEKIKELENEIFKKLI